MTHVRRAAGRVSVVAAVALLLSCAAPRLDLSFDYGPEAQPAGRVFKGVLGVDEFVDMRPQASTSEARKWLGFIPGVLWVDFVSEVPDRYLSFSDFRSGPFTGVFPRAIFDGLKKGGPFEDVVYLPMDRYARVDYRLEGVINRTLLKETAYYYGSGLYAWVTRVIGLPYVSYEIDLDMTLRLRRVDTNEVVWTYDIRSSRRDKYYNVYALTAGREGKNVLAYGFSKILEKEMPAALDSMRGALEGK